MRPRSGFSTAVAGVLGLALGGIQLGGLGYSSLSEISVTMWIALVALTAIVLMALILATSVLVSDGIAFDALKKDWRLAHARQYINTHAAPYDTKYKTYMEELGANYDWVTRVLTTGKRAADDPTVTAILQRVDQALSIASWRDALARYALLRFATFLLVPLAMFCALLIATSAHRDALPKDGSTRNEPIALSDADRAALVSAGWHADCAKASSLDLLAYADPRPGVSEGMLFGGPGCRPRRVLAAGGHILAVLPEPGP